MHRLHGSAVKGKGQIIDYRAQKTLLDRQEVKMLMRRNFPHCEGDGPRQGLLARGPFLGKLACGLKLGRRPQSTMFVSDKVNVT